MDSHNPPQTTAAIPPPLDATTPAQSDNSQSACLKFFCLPELVEVLVSFIKLDNNPNTRAGRAELLRISSVALEWRYPALARRWSILTSLAPINRLRALEPTSHAYQYMVRNLHVKDRLEIQRMAPNQILPLSNLESLTLGEKGVDNRRAEVIRTSWVPVLLHAKLRNLEIHRPFVVTPAFSFEIAKCCRYLERLTVSLEDNRFSMRVLTCLVMCLPHLTYLKVESPKYILGYASSNDITEMLRALGERNSLKGLNFDVRVPDLANVDTSAEQQQLANLKTFHAWDASVGTLCRLSSLAPALKKLDIDVMQDWNPEGDFLLDSRLSSFVSLKILLLGVADYSALTNTDLRHFGRMKKLQTLCLTIHNDSTANHTPPTLSNVVLISIADDLPDLQELRLPIHHSTVTSRGLVELGYLCSGLLHIELKGDFDLNAYGTQAYGLASEYKVDGEDECPNFPCVQTLVLGDVHLGVDPNGNRGLEMFARSKARHSLKNHMPNLEEVILQGEDALTESINAAIDEGTWAPDILDEEEEEDTEEGGKEGETDPQSEDESQTTNIQAGESKNNKEGQGGHERDDMEVDGDEYTAN